MASSYDDIIHLPHYVSTTYSQMPRSNRAAQFSPFAALTGYSEALREAARITDVRKELSDVVLAELNMKLHMLGDIMDEHPEITVTFFKPDEKKNGGAYVMITGNVKKIDEYEQLIVFVTGEKIPLEDISDIQSELFKD